MRAWHTLSKEELYKVLESGDHGLQSQEAAKRLAEYGKNELRFNTESLWKKIIEPFRSIFVAVLLFAAIVSALNHEVINAFIIGIVLVINAIIFWAQQYATSRVLRTLKKTAEQQVSVVRSGKVITISIIDLVPGDIVRLSEGQQVPADLRVLHDDNIQVDESALTGESLPVEKQAGVVPDETPLYGRHNMLFRGTFIVSGTVTALVVETGMQTEFGAIANLTANRETKSPVQQKIDHTVTVLIRVTAVVTLVVFALTQIRGIELAEAITFAITVAVSMVPEGLPIALTIAIVFGMRRMAKKRALVRSFRAIEDIGQLTTIATDKTGTLTKNKLSVVDIWQLKKAVPALPVLHHGIGDEHAVSDPLDVAFVEYIRNKKHRSQGLLVQTYPFEQDLRMSGAAWATGKGTAQTTISVKGAPEHILRLSTLSRTAHHEAESIMHHYAAEGYRVLALATITVKKAPEKLADIKKMKLEFVGFVACADELRPEAKMAIKQAHQAGIRVRLVTGDHFETAFNIARTVGIADSRAQVMNGHDLPEDDEKLAQLVQGKTVFARVLPNDKFRILKALQKTEIVAMTGDGVNDVPALSNAHVGIAMGSGSDIAKDASDMVLLDSNFATTIHAVHEGRVVYNNIRRMLFYLFATTLGEVITMIGALLIGLPLPVTAVMILWVNLVTDTALVIPLGLESPEGDEMSRPPRSPNEPILTPAYVTRIILVGATMAIVTLATFKYFLDLGYNELYAQTIAFMVLIVAQWANALNARSERTSLFMRARVINKKMAFGLTAAVILQSLVMFGPLGGLFDIQPVSLAHLGYSVLIMVAAVIAVAEIHKYTVRALHRRTDTQ